jgi:hypothetical protein
MNGGETTSPSRREDCDGHGGAGEKDMGLEISCSSVRVRDATESQGGGRMLARR